MLECILLVLTRQNTRDRLRLMCSALNRAGLNAKNVLVGTEKVCGSVKQKYEVVAPAVH
jgi:hypothetical protein